MDLFLNTKMVSIINIDKSTSQSDCENHLKTNQNKLRVHMTHNA